MSSAISEHQLITPRRNFLIRALGFTVAGATVTIPVLVQDTLQKRIDHHLAELTNLLEQQYPGATLLSSVRNWEAWRGLIHAGDIIATVRVHGSAPRLNTYVPGIDDDGEQS
jgi:hypothetical protein